jgi:hypothetical protein
MKPVSKAIIGKMKEEYEKTIHKSSTKKLKKKFPDRPWIEEAKSLWVSKKELLALLEDNNANGLRIHFGCHHESTHEDTKKDMQGLHTIILVATIDSVNPDNPTTQNSVDQLNDNLVKPKSGIGLYAGGGGDNLPICPPTCS